MRHDRGHQGGRRRGVRDALVLPSRLPPRCLNVRENQPCPILTLVVNPGHAGVTPTPRRLSRTRAGRTNMTFTRVVTKGGWRMPREKRNRSQLVTSVAMPSSGYRALLTDIKARIRVAQIKASLSVNRELIQLYWDIGEVIVGRQQSQGWGKSVVERLAADLRKEFPGMAGFSPQNIWYMRALYLAWTDEVENLQRSVGDSDRQVLQRAIANGWSRNMLVHWMESDLYSRQGKAVTSFKNALPQAQSDLANEIVRDPYNFEFLTLRDQAAEKELEDGLLAHIRKFLIELGAGFAFVGQQVHLNARHGASG